MGVEADRVGEDGEAKPASVPLGNGLQGGEVLLFQHVNAGGDLSGSRYGGKGSAEQNGQ